MCNRGMLVSTPSVACRESREARGWLPALAQKRPVGAYADRHEDIGDIDALVERPVHTATVGHARQSSGDHEARRERAGQERGGVEADDVGGVKGVQAEACACTDRVDDVCSSCHSRLFGIWRPA